MNTQCSVEPIQVLPKSSRSTGATCQLRAARPAVSQSGLAPRAQPSRATVSSADDKSTDRVAHVDRRREPTARVQYRGFDMGRVEKTVFLSYRRINAPWALAIFQSLNHHGYDVFAEVANGRPSDFARVQAQILARAHFLVLLTPSALEASGRSDALRREIRAALELERHIIPLVLRPVGLDAACVTDQLTGALAPLRRYEPLPISALGFTDAMDRLRMALSAPVDAVIMPASVSTQQDAHAQRLAAAAAPTVDDRVLAAQEYYERAVAATDVEERSTYLAQAIDLNRYPQQAAASNPSYAAALNTRGLLRSAQGDRGGARDDYDRAIQANPSYAAAFYNRAMLRAAEGDWSGAREDYDHAIALNPRDAAAFNNRGLLREAQGDRPGAREDYDTAIRLNPADSGVFNNRGLHRDAIGDHAGALEDYDTAIRLNPCFAAPYNNRALLRNALGDHLGAQEDFDAAVRLDPLDAAAHNNRGSFRSARGDSAGARADFDTAIRLNPLDATAYNNRGLLRAKQGDHAGALEDYDTAIRLNATFAAAFYNRATLRKTLGDRAGARQDQATARRLNPDLKGSETTRLVNRILGRPR